MAKINDRVLGNWGAMFPTTEGVIIGWDAQKGFLIQWDEWCNMGPGYYEVHAAGYRSANGSPVGVTLDEMPEDDYVEFPAGEFAPQANIGPLR